MSNNYQGGGGYRGGGGRGGRNSGGRNNYRGGGGGRGRGRGNNYGGRGPHAPKAKFKPTDTCPHIVQLHGTVDASSNVNTNNQNNNGNGYNNNYNNNNNRGYQQKASLSSVAIWEAAPNMIKIFTGSHDGFWRLWNTAGGNFVKEFESDMKGKVDCLAVVNNFLFCGFEAISRALPACNVGMVHAWNLQQPGNPPAELQVQAQPANTLPYAHNQAVTAICIEAPEGAPPKIVSGSRDGAIRVWEFRESSFVLVQTLPGHGREVTGLVLLMKPNPLLWSCSTDGSIRIWDLSKATDACQYCITRDTPATGSNPPQSPQAGSAAAGVGHTNAVTELLSFETGGQSFVLSSSLDGTIKAWNGLTGDCVASESHGGGVVSMALAADAQGHQLLLIGLESGNIMCRNLVQQGPNGDAAFSLLFILGSKWTAGHDGAVTALAAGPSATFYSCGRDGKLLVWQFTGDLGLK